MIQMQTPNPRTYRRVESYANTALENLKSTSKELDVLLFKSNLNITEDEVYISDKEHDRGQVFKLITAMDGYVKILNDKEITYPPDAKPVDLSEDLATLVSNLIDAQTKNQDKLLNTLVTNQDKNSDNLVKAQ